MLHSGLDLHKRTLAISTVNPDGRPVRDVQLPTTRDAITAYCAALPGGPGAQRAVVESTSTWYWLRDLLTPQGVDLRLAHAKQVQAIRDAKVKTDAVDAATLAPLLRGALVPEAHRGSPEWREARDLLRARLQLVRQQVRVKNPGTGLLAPYNVPDPDALPARVQRRVHLRREPFVLLGDQAKRLDQAKRRAAELNPVLVPTSAVQRLLWIPGVGRVVAFTLWLAVARAPRLLRPRQAGGSQRHVQGYAAESHEDAAVAPPGQPRRLTGAGSSEPCIAAVCDWAPDGAAAAGPLRPAPGLRTRGGCVAATEASGRDRPEGTTAAPHDRPYGTTLTR